MNNNGRSRGMTLAQGFNMKTYNNLYQQVCDLENLKLAHKKARKGKTLKSYVVEFEKNLKENLQIIRTELLFHSYRPLPLKTFILRDPKTRKISVSDFKDRIVHHAICNIIEPIFDNKFIFDSYANRKGKGSLAAIQRFNKFSRKVSHNATLVNNSKNIRGFCLKCDIKQYFDSMDHEKLLDIVAKSIKDKKLLFLLRTILKNHNSKQQGKGMPLGNLTSQFLANVYLNELDQYVKHKLKAKYYIRYVDDFVILHNNIDMLAKYKNQIIEFLNQNLLIQISESKTKIQPISRGVDFLGFKIFYYHKLLRKRNIRKCFRNINHLKQRYDEKQLTYDEVYDYIQGWFAYAKNANTHKLRHKITAIIDSFFIGQMSMIEIDRWIKTMKEQAM